MTQDNELSARERIEAHALCRDMDELAERAAWAGWLLRPLARLIRQMDAELHRPDRLDY